MKQVKKGESVSRTARVDGQKVFFQHVTLNRPSGVQYLLRTGFDFTGVPDEVVRRLAGETLLIRWRTAFKDAKKVDDAADNQLVSVVKMLAGRKPRLSKAERVEKLVPDLSAAEKIALLQRLQAEIGEIDEQDEDETEEEEEENT